MKNRTMQKNEKSKLFCFGFGKVGTMLSCRMQEEKWQVTGTNRERRTGSEQSAPEITHLIFDGKTYAKDISHALEMTTHLLQSIPPGKEGDPALHLHKRDITRARNLHWIGYLSTIGVYGDHEGAWIDEETPPAPETERGRWRLRAEQEWIECAADMNVSLSIFRLAGIYGPHNNALLRLREGRAHRIIKPGQVFNRIHIKDIVSVIAASIERPPCKNRIYNVCDDEPAPPQEVITFAAQLMGVAPPEKIPFEQSKLTKMERGFYAANKRCKNERIKKELAVTLAYPDYRTGLQALCTEEKERKIKTCTVT
ncbi:MAG: SDR family oxidoreductase [Alphaproteobacteria bacterium]|nr:SDR family oxidoreductase [Alphaproteobacteria bacterium]